MDHLKVIKQKYSDKKISCCKESNCKLLLTGLSNPVILKGEKFTTKKIADCFVFGHSSKYLAGIIELKSRSLDISAIKEKFENSIKIVADILKEIDVDIPINIIILAKGWSPIDYRQFSKICIVHDGKRYPVLPKKCGGVFLEII